MEPDDAMTGTADNELYLERLETLYEKELSDIRAFAQREGRPFDEVSVRLAEWHCKSLFGLGGKGNNDLEAKERVSNILRAISQALESLLSIAGLQSFFLAVNPNAPRDEGFLGGTLLGREFWRGHRGCGAAGAKAFQTYCQRATAAQQPREIQSCPLPPPSGPQLQLANASSVKKGPAGALKAEVYASIRDAIRAASGTRNAEMKWTNHAKLSQYGVRLEGWPDDIPMQNPSTLSTAQNRSILDALARGTLKFIPLDTDSAVPGGTTSLQDHASPTGDEEQDVFAEAVDFSWDEYDAGDDSDAASMMAAVFDSNGYYIQDRATAGSHRTGNSPSSSIRGGSRHGETEAVGPLNRGVDRKRKREQSQDPAS